MPYGTFATFSGQQKTYAKTCAGLTMARIVPPVL